MSPLRVRSRLVALAAVWCVACGERQVPAGAAAVGEPAEDVLALEAAAEPIALQFYRDPAAVSSFTVRDLDGRVVSPADWRGKVTIVNFWATWCPPCRAEIPDLIALQDKYRDHLQIVGVSEDDDPPEVVRRFVEQNGMNYPVVMTTPEVQKAFPGVTALPTSFIVDREGRVVQKHVGILDARTTEAEARALAGLPVNASIEHVDKDRPVKLANAAQATEIPGVDLDALPKEQRIAAIQKLNEEACSCGCNLTVARCRVDDPQCSYSLPRAREIVAEITKS
jgi:thiol-disulfide isomerase/thioredoxin